MYKCETCREGGCTAVSEGKTVISAFPVVHVFLLVPGDTTAGQLLIVMQLGKWRQNWGYLVPPPSRITTEH